MNGTRLNREKGWLIQRVKQTTPTGHEECLRDARDSSKRRNLPVVGGESREGEVIRKQVG